MAGQLASLNREKPKDIPWLEIPRDLAYCKSNWQSYPVCIREDSPVDWDNLMQDLLDMGVSTRRGIMNAHQEPPYSLIALRNQSEKAKDSVILLPLFNDMKEEEVDEVAKKVRTNG
jgi:perosamine synthetase